MAAVQACAPTAQFQAVVPPGAVPGQVLQVQTPDGQLVQVAAPAGCAPGMQFAVGYTPRATGAVPLMAQPVMVPQQQAMGAAPGGFSYMPFAPGAMPDPFAVLAGLQEVKIKQQVQWGEVIFGFDMPNKYIISDPRTGHDLFVAAERNDGVMGVLGRQVFQGGQRPFNLDIAMLTGSGMQPIPFMRLERPFKCTCCCFQRPEVSFFNTMTNELIGTSHEPCSCCHLRLGIRDPSKNDVLRINHHCCDCSLLCWGCCCGCQETDFHVKDGDTTVGHIRRQFNREQALGMVTGINADSDQFQVEFVDIRDPKWKGVLIGTALFLDYAYFVKGGKEAREESALGRVVQNNRGAEQAMGGAARFFE